MEALAAARNGHHPGCTADKVANAWMSEPTRAEGLSQSLKCSEKWLKIRIFKRNIIELSVWNYGSRTEGGSKEGGK